MPLHLDIKSPRPSIVTDFLVTLNTWFIRCCLCFTGLTFTSGPPLPTYKMFFRGAFPFKCGKTTHFGVVAFQIGSDLTRLNGDFTRFKLDFSDQCRHWLLVVANLEPPNCCFKSSFILAKLESIWVILVLGRVILRVLGRGGRSWSISCLLGDGLSILEKSESAIQYRAW